LYRHQWTLLVSRLARMVGMVVEHAHLALMFLNAQTR